MSEVPAWIKRAENGAIGEARARAFLLERFWLLERSIDKDGADYLIQRRLTEDNFLSRDPPRLGVVQVKFVQDEKTAVYIKTDYVLDADGRPYGEFYLLVHTGTEDSERQFIISGKEIASGFAISNDQYYLPAKEILSGTRYEVLNKKIALDKIEHSLNNANFLRNRTYLSASTYVKIDKSHIETDYLLPIQNGYCDFDTEFFMQKKKIQSTLFELEEVVEALQKILRSTDPIEAWQIYEESIEEYLNRNGWRSSLNFGAEFFDDEDFISAAKNHRDRVGKIRSLGLENSYLKLLSDYEKQVMDKIVNEILWEKMEILCVSVKYDPENLKLEEINTHLDAFTEASYPMVTQSKPGRIVVNFYPKQMEHRWKEDQEKPAIEVVRDKSWQLSRALQKELDRHLLGDELVSAWL